MFSESLTIWLISLSLAAWMFWAAVRLFSRGDEIAALWVGGSAFVVFFGALVVGGLVA
ncbi:MAG: hypothetical protein ABW063_13695 [Caulobacter sp.]